MQYKQFEAGKSERAHGALRKSTMVDRHLVEFTCKLHNLSFKKKKKKKNNHWSIEESKNRTTQEDSRRKTRQENPIAERVAKEERTSLFSA